MPESTSTARPAATVSCPALELLIQYFRFGYHLLFLPYKIELAEVKETLNGDSFQIRTSIPHKIVAGLLQFLSFYVSFTYSRIIYIYEGNSYIIAFSDSLPTFLYKGAFLHAIWRKETGILAVFGEVEKRRTTEAKMRPQELKWA